MKRKQYYICYEVNLEKLLFIVLVYDKAQKNVYKVTFSRNNMVEECMDQMFSYYLGKCNRKLSKEATEYLQDYMQRKQIYD